MKSKGISILVVDDSPSARELICEPLYWLGYNAKGVNTSAEALALLHWEHFDFMLTDLVLPDASGIALANAASWVYRHMHVIFASDSPGPSLSEYRHPCDFVWKPYHLRDVLDVMARRLSERGNRPAEPLMMASSVLCG